MMREVRSPVLLIHGGGWTSLDSRSVEGLARVMREAGHRVESIDYRLAPAHRWPACLEDCVEAARELCAKSHTGRLLVAGASAGGHLALLTGLAMGAGLCAGVFALSPITRIRNGHPSCGGLFTEEHLSALFGSLPDEWLCRSASPIDRLHSSAPLLWLTHSLNDQLVPPAHSIEMESAAKALGIAVELKLFNGPGELHGVWLEEMDDLSRREPVPEVRESLLEWLVATRPDRIRTLQNQPL